MRSILCRRCSSGANRRQGPRTLRHCKHPCRRFPRRSPRHRRLLPRYKHTRGQTGVAFFDPVATAIDLAVAGVKRVRVASGLRGDNRQRCQAMPRRVKKWCRIEMLTVSADTTRRRRRGRTDSMAPPFGSRAEFGRSAIVMRCQFSLPRVRLMPRGTTCWLLSMAGV